MTTETSRGRSRGPDPTTSTRTIALLAELRRDETFGVDPAASRLWLEAPAGLRRQYVNAWCDARAFWQALDRWLRFQVGEAA